MLVGVVQGPGRTRMVWKPKQNTKTPPPEPFNARVRCTPAFKSDPHEPFNARVRYTPALKSDPPNHSMQECAALPHSNQTPAQYTGTPYPGTPCFCSPSASEHPL